MFDLIYIDFMDKNNNPLNININLNVNVKVSFENVNRSLELSDHNNSWAAASEQNLLSDLFQEIEKDSVIKERKIKNTLNTLLPLLNNIDVSFEPDPTYRDNVKYIIIGLVLCQILKQKTINLYRRGKEDREYLASFLMMKIQSYLINNHDIDEWDEVLKGILKHYEGKIRLDKDMCKLISNGINKDKIITQDILVSTVISNKKNYKAKKFTEPKNYE